MTARTSIGLRQPSSLSVGSSERTPIARRSGFYSTDFNKSIEQEMGKERIQRASYDSRSHTNVLCQMHGSAWPKVLPYCLLNLAWIGLVAFLKDHTPINLTFNSLKAFTIMGILVSFLIVSRVTMVFNHYMSARGSLAMCFRAARTVSYYCALFTKQERTEAAVKWRSDVACQCIMALQVMTSANEHDLDNPTRPYGSWSMVPREIQKRLGYADDTMEAKWSHGERSINDENFRAPIIMSFMLQKIIMQNRGVLEQRMAVNEELAVLAAVQEFLTGYHGIHMIITTTFPFPLAQMTRTFLFFWVFTLPLGLLNLGDPVWQTMVIMFFLTYGYIGLEFVSIEMDDPFGDDATDFDDDAWMQCVMEDVYIGIFEVDGARAASKLRKRVVDHIRYGDESFLEDLEQGNES